MQWVWNKAVPEKPYDRYLILEEDFTLGEYFVFWDTLLRTQDSLFSDSLSEYEMVHFNPWILDSLVATDYYRSVEAGKPIHDFNNHPILSAGDTLFFPKEKIAKKIGERISRFRIDVNIPEFKLRIFESDSVIHECPVRVGRDELKFLAMAGREVDLKTKTGKGEIVRINRYPRFINPADNKEYKSTKRDDGVRTGLPTVPWIEPSINGIRHGQLLHPTTNLNTLGKAYSNGCIGMSEADAWLVYYHAPLGTPIEIRYDLEALDENGNTIFLENIYQYSLEPPTAYFDVLNSPVCMCLL